MYNGFFINLDRSRSRQQEMRQHLSSIGLGERYERFAAVDGKAVASQFDTTLEPGALGCWLSHLRILEANHGSTEHLHILEDDTIFAHDVAAFFDPLLELLDTKAPDWDLMFTDIYIAPETSIFIRFAKKMSEFRERGSISIQALGDVNFAGTNSYFVNRKSIRKLTLLLDGQWSSNIPIDLYLRNLVKSGHVNAYVSVPFLSTLGATSDASEIRGGQDISRNVAMLYRRGFFKNANYKHLIETMNVLTADVNVKPLEMLFVQSVMFALSDAQVQF